MCQSVRHVWRAEGRILLRQRCATFDLCITLPDSRQAPAREERGHPVCHAFSLGNVSSSELTNYSPWKMNSTPQWLGGMGSMLSGGAGFFSQTGDNSVLLSLIFKKNLFSCHIVNLREENNYEKLLLTNYDRLGRWVRTNTERDVLCISYQMSCYYSDHHEIKTSWKNRYIQQNPSSQELTTYKRNLLPSPFHWTFLLPTWHS